MHSWPHRYPFVLVKSSFLAAKIFQQALSGLQKEILLTICPIKNDGSTPCYIESSLWSFLKKEYLGVVYKHFLLKSLQGNELKHLQSSIWKASLLCTSCWEVGTDSCTGIFPDPGVGIKMATSWTDLAMFIRWCYMSNMVTSLHS